MGILTGKYNDQIPEISRSAEGLPFFPKDLLNGLFFDKHRILFNPYNQK